MILPPHSSHLTQPHDVTECLRVSITEKYKVTKPGTRSYSKVHGKSINFGSFHLGNSSTSRVPDCRRSFNLGLCCDVGLYCRRFFGQESWQLPRCTVQIRGSLPTPGLYKGGRAPIFYGVEFRPPGHKAQCPELSCDSFCRNRKF